MDLLTIIIIGFGLSMDCFAVSISKGICVRKFHIGYTIRMAFMFGLFQAVMPLIGYLAGEAFSTYMKAVDHWIAFGLLSLIGGKMLWESIRNKNLNFKSDSNPFKWSSILSLALATSIDALATGVVFVPFPDTILRAVLIIGLTSFIFTIIGMFIGVHFGKRFHINVEMIGGIILIALGLKILIENIIVNS